MERTIGQTLFELRDNMGISQEMVADGVGVSRVTYTRYENGTRKPEAEIAIKLAHYFGVSVEYLFGFSDAEEHNEKTPTANGDGLDEALVNLLVDLSPAEVQRVVDFVAGLKASRTKDASRQE